MMWRPTVLWNEQAQLFVLLTAKVIGGPEFSFLGANGAVVDQARSVVWRPLTTSL